MRKEILFAIIAGILLGLVVAFGVWRTNSVLKEKDVVGANSEISISPPQPASEFGLTISEPEEKDVMVDSTAKVVGISRANVWITISGENKDYILKSDNSGKFEQDIELTGGVNQIVVTAHDETGATTFEKVNVIYSSEFEEEVSLGESSEREL